jgi:transposase
MAIHLFYEIEGTTSEIFYKYLVKFSKHKPKELKIILIDNAGFHSLKRYEIPSNIRLIRIPPYTPELNPAEKIWYYMKQKFKNKVFDNLSNVKLWLHDFVKNELNQKLVMSITHNKFYFDVFVNHFDI